MPFRTSNPAMREDVFKPAQTWDDLKAQGRDIPGAELDPSGAGEPPRSPASVGARTMTIGGTASKTLFLLALCVTTACLTWGYLLPWDAKAGHHASSISHDPLPPLFGGMIVGLIAGLATSFKPMWAPATAPIYALAEGCFVGGVSAWYAVKFGVTRDGSLTPNYAMIFQALGLTFGVLGTMLALYAGRIIRPTEKLKAGIVAATGGVCLLYLASMLLGFFGVRMPYLHESGPIGIGLSAVVVVIAAFNFVLDFDFVETGVRSGAPARLEWYGGFALLVTLVWLYLEILRLLSKIQSRD